MSLSENILRRIARADRAAREEDYQALCLAVAAADILTFVNDWCWTYDPRELHCSTLPFLLFDRQEEFLLWLEARLKAQDDGLAEKCRDVGFTWLCAAFAVHKWLFCPGFKCGFGSRKLDLVDKVGDPDSIFEKIRFLINSLPYWMQPKGYRQGKHDGYCKIVNPENGNVITGEGGDNIGRGGRNSIYFVDEHAFLERADKVEAALSQNCRVKIRVSTPNGMGNAFYRLRFGGKIAVFTFRWKDDPRKNGWIAVNDDGAVLFHGNGEAPGEVLASGLQVLYPWYEKQKDTLDGVILAQEVDIDYAASVEGVIIPAKWVQCAINLELPRRGPIKAGWDLAQGGKNLDVWLPMQGPVILAVESWSDADTYENTLKVVDLMRQYEATTFAYDSVGPGHDVAHNLRRIFGEAEIPFGIAPVNGGAPPSDAIWPDGKTSKEKFLNKRAELYWMLRSRFEKTYEFVTKGVQHPLDELISIPNHPTLIAQLSVPLYMRTETGKVQVESKMQMAKRGIVSPDHADAAAYTQEKQPDWSEVLQIHEAAEAKEEDGEYRLESMNAPW